MNEDLNYKNEGPVVYRKRGGSVPMWDKLFTFETVMQAEEYVSEMNGRIAKQRKEIKDRKNRSVK